MKSVLGERYVCTTAAPWDESKGRAVHPDAKAYGDSVYRDDYECPNCGLRFSVEVPE